MMKKITCQILIVVIVLQTLPAYSISYLTDGTKNADKIANNADFRKQQIPTSAFILTILYQD